MPQAEEYGRSVNKELYIECQPNQVIETYVIQRNSLQEENKDTDHTDPDNKNDVSDYLQHQ